MADLEALEHWVGPLLQRIASAARTKLARTVAKDLRRSQQQRVIAQRNPDGSPYAPRKPRQLRGKKGRVRRKVKMFQKLKTASFLKANGNAACAMVGFSGHVAKIARVHQYGLEDRVLRQGPRTTYDKREIVGFAESERTRIVDILLDHLPK